MRLARMPTFDQHLALLEHDALHGQKAPAMGPRVHWLKMWLAQRSRQWTPVDAVVAGSNPVLGALLCAGLARKGKTVAWVSSPDADFWDYPLCMRGEHDDLMAQAGLPPMGRAWFASMAAMCEGRLIRVKGARVDYVHASERVGALKIAFASLGSPEGAALVGESHRQALEWAQQAFARSSTLAPLSKPKRLRGELRQQLIACEQLGWTSARRDGVALEQKANPEAPRDLGASELRLGRSRWHSQVPLDFAAQSRLDLKIALEHGGWHGE